MSVDLCIDGQEVSSQSSEYFPVIDPGRGQAIGDADRV